MLGVAANILNKQSLTTEKGWSAVYYVTKWYTGPRTLTNSWERRKERKIFLD
jgi:hypothetical protein